MNSICPICPVRGGAWCPAHAAVEEACGDNELWKLPGVLLLCCLWCRNLTGHVVTRQAGCCMNEAAKQILMGKIRRFKTWDSFIYFPRAGVQRKGIHRAGIVARSSLVVSSFHPALDDDDPWWSLICLQMCSDFSDGFTVYQSYLFWEGWPVTTRAGWYPQSPVRWYRAPELILRQENYTEALGLLVTSRCYYNSETCGRGKASQRTGHRHLVCGVHLCRDLSRILTDSVLTEDWATEAELLGMLEGTRTQAGCKMLRETK